MSVTVLGIVMLVNPVQKPKASSPILVMPLAIMALVRLVQELNTSPSMLVTLPGIVMLLKLEQPKNASSPRLVTPLAIVALVRAAQ